MNNNIKMDLPGTIGRESMGQSDLHGASVEPGFQLLGGCSHVSLSWSLFAARQTQPESNNVSF